MAFPDYSEYAFSDHGLPTPIDTPYRAPSRSTSRRSSRQSASSPGPSHSPPPMPPPVSSNGRYSPTANPDPAIDENISILDPRRFTPTLHANLVSEILSLRRDLDSKNGVIEGLENSLHTTRDELDKLNEALSNNSKETRSLRRQLQSLEGGTSSTLGELAKERDEAVENTAEIKKRLEISQKKIRSQEEEADRFQTLWQRDKENWDGEKRNLERKIHIVEGRLKAVLDEVALHAAAQPHINNTTIHQDSETDDAIKDSGAGPGSDTASIQSAGAPKRRPVSSMYSDDGMRLSMLSGPNGYGGAKFNGLSLADELDFDETEEEQPNESGDEGALPHDARTSATGQDLSKSVNHGVPPNVERPLVNGEALAALEAAAKPDLTEVFPRPPSANGQISVIKVDYVDIGVQYSPPPSPQLQTSTLDSQKMEKVEGRAATPTRESDHEANQRRKRVSLNNAIPPNCQISAIIIPSPMVSVSSQTLEGPLSPPRTPKTPTRTPASPLQEVSTASIGTQTETVEPPKPRRAPPPPPIPIPVPSITIHPPTSAPTTPGICMLPPNTKNASCQVSMKSMVKLRSISMQTEEIRIDNRPVQLPAHLLPSAISSQPPTPEPDESLQSVPVPPPRSLRRGQINRHPTDPPSSPPMPSPALHSETQDAYPGNNDNGPIGDDKATGIRRPFRSSSLFAGFEIPSSDDADEFGEPDLSDSDYRTALSAPKPRSNSKKHGKLVSRPPRSVPEDTEPNDGSVAELPVGATRQTGPASNAGSTMSNAQPALGRRKSPDRVQKPGFRRLDKPLTLNTKQPNIRKSAMISSGTAAHTQQAKTSGLESAVVFKELGPPFPVPTRASSRNKPFSVSDGTRSPTPQSSTYSSHRRRGGGAPPVRRDSIRKVRSAAALPRSGRRRSRSPPPLSTSSIAPDSPQLPPMPRDDITAPRYMQDRYRYNHGANHRHHPSTNTSNTGGASIGSSIQQVSVVDAIAQTMVGEWMWKYVRRRKSFGVPESPQTGWENGRMGDDGSTGISGNGIRHKRWVWLAPYERCVMWSSRQPTNGTALLGKTGRKCKLLENHFLSYIRSNILLSGDTISVGCQG
jgi:Meiotic cell cortex C-terminal pleckstrin homology